MNKIVIGERNEWWVISGCGVCTIFQVVSSQRRIPNAKASEEKVGSPPVTSSGAAQGTVPNLGEWAGLKIHKHINVTNIKKY